MNTKGFRLLLFKSAILALLFAVSLITPIDSARADSLRDDRVRAAIIYNLIRFTRWPSEAFETTSSSLNICVSHTASIAEGLKGVQGKLLQDRSIAVVLVQHLPSQLENCQVVVLTPEIAGLDLSHSPIHTLYVSTEEGLAPSISAIELVAVGRQTRFNVNPSIAKKSGIEISSKLINLAVKVQ